MGEELLRSGADVDFKDAGGEGAVAYLLVLHDRPSELTRIPCTDLASHLSLM